MRISDWSSDVCSSDLDRQRVGAGYLRRSCRRQRADRHFVAEAEDRRGRAIERQQDVRRAAARFHRKVTAFDDQPADQAVIRSEEHTSELQSLMRISYAVFCLKKKKKQKKKNNLRP